MNAARREAGFEKPSDRPTDELTDELTDAVDRLTGAQLEPIDDIVHGLEPFVARLEEVKRHSGAGVNRDDIARVRRRLHELNEVITHLRLVHTGLIDIAEAIGGAYGQDGQPTEHRPKRLRVEG